MPNGNHAPDEDEPKACLDALFPYGLLDDYLRQRAYAEIEVEKRGDDLYSVSLRLNDEPVGANVLEAQFAAIVTEMTNGEWRIVDTRTILANQRAAVEIRVART